MTKWADHTDETMIQHINELHAGALVMKRCKLCGRMGLCRRCDKGGVHRKCRDKVISKEKR